MQRVLKLGRVLSSYAIVGLLFLSPQLGAAQEGLVPACPVGKTCAETYHPDNYGPCEVVALANNLISFFMTVGLLVITIVIVYAGYLLVISRGNSAQIAKAKGMFTNILIGLVIILSAFLVINTIMGVLVGSSSSLLNWNSIQCQYSYNAPDPARVSLTLKPQLTQLQLDTFTNTYVTNQTQLTSSAGVCTSGEISQVWGSLSSAANCIITNESSCGALPISTTDYGTDKNPFSFGVMQVNTTVHKVIGCGPTLDCPSAWSGTNYNAHVVNPTLYKQCVDALLDPTCNMINGKRIYQEAGNSWRPWSTARGCGLQ